MAESSRLTQLQIIDGSYLRKINVRPRFYDYIRQLWARRFFIWEDSKGQALKAGQNQYLGWLWLFINPLIQVSVYAVVFGLILKVHRGMDNFIGFLVIGVIFFGMLSGGLSDGNSLIQRSRGMITSFEFPKASLAFSTNLRSMLNNVVPAMVAIVIALLFQLDSIPSWTLLLVIPAYVLMYVMATGFTLIIARATAFIPDLSAIVSLTTRALFFLSGVFYPVTRFIQDEEILRWVNLNPFAAFLNLFRALVLDGSPGALTDWIYLSLLSIAILVIGLFYFWRAEDRYTNVK